MTYSLNNGGQEGQHEACSPQTGAEHLGRPQLRFVLTRYYYGDGGVEVLVADVLWRLMMRSKVGGMVGQLVAAGAASHVSATMRLGLARDLLSAGGAPPHSHPHTHS